MKRKHEIQGKLTSTLEKTKICTRQKSTVVTSSRVKSISTEQSTALAECSNNPVARKERVLIGEKIRKLVFSATLIINI